MKNRGETGYRYFFLAFAAAFFVLTLSLFLLMNAVHPRTPPSLLADAALTQETAYLPEESEKLTVFFAGVSQDGSDAGTFLLIKFDPLSGTIPIIAFPPETTIFNAGKTQTLRECYQYAGAARTRDALAATLGITIDRYVRMDEHAFIIAANAVGTVEYELVSPVKLGASGGMPALLNRGIHLLDGQKAAGILRGENFTSSLERCENTARLAAAVVNQRMDIVLSTVVDKVFEKIINLIETDISYLDYDNRKQAAKFMAKLEKQPAVYLPVAGSFDKDNERFALSDTFIASVIQAFN